jgi:hypothetical protein
MANYDRIVFAWMLVFIMTTTSIAQTINNGGGSTNITGSDANVTDPTPTSTPAPISSSNSQIQDPNVTFAAGVWNNVWWVSVGVDSFLIVLSVTILVRRWYIAEKASAEGERIAAEMQKRMREGLLQEAPAPEPAMVEFLKKRAAGSDDADPFALRV